jgi:hypothetical protein
VLYIIRSTINALAHAGLAVDRRQNYIDGFQRQENPEWSRQEKEEYNVRFLIGTVETGGVGVTFNIADRILLLEPH